MKYVLSQKREKILAIRNFVLSLDLYRRLRRHFASATDAPSPSDFVCHLSRFIGRAFPIGESKTKIDFYVLDNLKTIKTSIFYGQKIVNKVIVNYLYCYLSNTYSIRSYAKKLNNLAFPYGESGGEAVDRGLNVKYYALPIF